MGVKCIICLDSKYLAVHNEDPNDIVPMLQVLGSDLADYRLIQCDCMKQNKADVLREEVAELKQEKKNAEQKQLKL